MENPIDDVQGNSPPHSSIPTPYSLLPTPSIIPYSLLPFFILAGLTLLFFIDLVLNPTDVLYSDYSDFIALHIPARRFMVRSFHETGELPLWDPNTFAGSPFAHDMQMAIFYPPHLLLCLLPEQSAGAALSWLLVLHVWLAGAAMFLYARSQNLKSLPALAAAVCYMFAGKFLFHLLLGGHYLVIGLAWLPLVLLCLERAIQRGRLAWACAAGCVFALITFSTQPQWTFYAGLFVAVWTLGDALHHAGVWNKDQPALMTLRVALLRWLCFGIVTMLSALGLAAVQLLPAAEAVQHATRSAGISAGHSGSNPLMSLLLLAGPPLSRQPLNFLWEERGGFAILLLMTAVLAPLLQGGRTRYRALLTAGIIVLALCGGSLLQHVPGFRLFRHHTRLLMIAALPVALFAGVAVQQLFAEKPSEELCRRCRRVMLWTLAACLLSVASLLTLQWLNGIRPMLHLYWLVLLVTVPFLFRLLRCDSQMSLAARQNWWCLLLLVDVWLMTWPLVATRNERDIYAPSECVQFVMEQQEKPWRVLDRDVTATGPTSPLGSGAPLARVHGVQTLRGFNPIDVMRYKEYLQFITDKDQPLRAFDGPLTYPLLGEFPIENDSLFNLLGVRYVLLPKDTDNIEDGCSCVVVDPKPRAYDVHNGMIPLPPYAVYENPAAFPRAFVVPQAKRLPQRRDVLPALKNADLRSTVFLENMGNDKDAPLPLTKPRSPAIEEKVRARTVEIREYHPNYVVIHVGSGPPGFLVLTDVWFPGWTCETKGRPAKLFRANYAFRAVEVDGDAQEVYFAFAPASLTHGLWLTGLTVLVIGVVFAIAFIRRWIVP